MSEKRVHVLAFSVNFGIFSHVAHPISPFHLLKEKCVFEFFWRNGLIFDPLRVIISGGEFETFLTNAANRLRKKQN